LLAARFPGRIGALRFRVDFILAQDFAVGFHTRGVAVAVMTVILPGILVDPSFLEPFARIWFIWRNQVKALRVGTSKVAEGLYVARHQEIEWLDLIDVFLSFVELFKGTHNGGAGNRRTTD
jgi:hypothetical protein